MRIAQVAPLIESVPPALYGGTERIVSYLTEELVRQGHEVTLFASGDSVTRARLVAACPRALRFDPDCRNPAPHHVVLLEQVFQRSPELDVIHFHIDYLQYPVLRRRPFPHVTTLHGRLDLADLRPLFREYREMPVTSISDSQRSPLPWLNWQATVHHGLPEDLHSLNEEPEGYLAFLGRVSPEKRLDLAIEIARRAGKPIRIAAKVDRADEDYFEQVIRPLLRQKHVEYLGEVGEAEKGELLGNADALLFPIDWPEPFGLVMIEAMACGTPVIAFRRGSVPEVIDDGETGFLCEDVEAATAAVGRLPEISRAACRRVFERRFSAARMAGDYLTIYQKQLERAADGRDPSGFGAALYPRHQLARG